MKFFRTDKSLLRQIKSLRAEVDALTADRNEALRNEAAALGLADEYHTELRRERERLANTLDRIEIMYSNGQRAFLNIQPGTIVKP